MRYVLKPIIGLTMNFVEQRFVVNEPYVEGITNCGGIPICIPLESEEIVDSIDGLLLTGGFDIDPKYYNENAHPQLGVVTARRDEAEMQLVKKCLDKNIPIFGICRGIQLLNVYFGGTLYQHIDAQYSTNIPHQQKEGRTVATHKVTVEKESKLYSIVQKECFQVNSMHHQGIRKLGKNLKAVAKSEDGLIEAIELENYPYCIAVQWHPEELLKVGDTFSKKMFQSFIESAKNYKKQKNV